VPAHQKLEGLTPEELEAATVSADDEPEETEIESKPEEAEVEAETPAAETAEQPVGDSEPEPEPEVVEGDGAEAS